MKIWLGKLSSNVDAPASGEAFYLEKHKWDCGWYWAMGYLGNVNNHFHFNSFLKDHKLASELFETTNITDDEWWVIRDLFKQAYALKEAAEVYQYGGHQTTRKGVTDILKSEDKAKALNADLKLVLELV